MLPLTASVHARSRYRCRTLNPSYKWRPKRLGWREVGGGPVSKLFKLSICRRHWTPAQRNLYGCPPADGILRFREVPGNRVVSPSATERRHAAPVITSLTFAPTLEFSAATFLEFLAAATRARLIPADLWLRPHIGFDRLFVKAPPRRHFGNCIANVVWVVHICDAFFP